MFILTYITQLVGKHCGIAYFKGWCIAMMMPVNPKGCITGFNKIK